MNPASQLSTRAKKIWTPARLALAAVVFALLVCFGASSCSRSTENNNASTATTKTTQPSVSVTSGGAPVNNASSAAGKRAATAALPAHVMQAEFKALDGKAIKLSDYAGKVLVLDMWATWCPPCRQEIPHLVNLSKEYAGRGVEVVGLDIDPGQDDVETVRSFAKEFNINYQVGWAEPDVALALMNGNGAIPQTLVITRDGRVIGHFRGYSETQTPPKMREAIEQALNHESGT
jgi:thiol-disulfide isomerase/thioredoxin